MVVKDNFQSLSDVLSLFFTLHQILYCKERVNAPFKYKIKFPLSLITPHTLPFPLLSPDLIVICLLFLFTLYFAVFDDFAENK
jgi:hypothetical protein